LCVCSAFVCVCACTFMYVSAFIMLFNCLSNNTSFTLSSFYCAFCYCHSVSQKRSWSPCVSSGPQCRTLVLSRPCVSHQSLSAGILSYQGPACLISPSLQASCLIKALCVSSVPLCRHLVILFQREPASQTVPYSLWVLVKSSAL
jgi:hypothetical protein